MPGQPVELVLRVDERLRPLVRADAVARIVTEGLVGAKVVEIVPGRPDAPPLGRLGRIAAEPPIEIADLLQQGLRLARHGSTPLAGPPSRAWARSTPSPPRSARARGASASSSSDDEAYRKLVALSARGERTLGDLEENLAALKRTWPLSRYFDRRAFFDRERVLFQPGAERNSRRLPRRRALRARPLGADAASAGPARRGRPLVQAGQPAASEVVIAAFTDDDRDPDLAQSSPRSRPTPSASTWSTQHSIQSAGWFSPQGRRRRLRQPCPPTLDPAPRAALAPGRDHPVHAAGVSDRNSRIRSSVRVIRQSENRESNAGITRIRTNNPIHCWIWLSCPAPPARSPQFAGDV